MVCMKRVIILPTKHLKNTKSWTERSQDVILKLYPGFLTPTVSIFMTAPLINHFPMGEDDAKKCKRTAIQNQNCLYIPKEGNIIMIVIASMICNNIIMIIVFKVTISITLIIVRLILRLTMKYSDSFFFFFFFGLHLLLLFVYPWNLQNIHIFFILYTNLFIRFSKEIYRIGWVASFPLPQVYFH